MPAPSGREVEGHWPPGEGAVWGLLRLWHTGETQGASGLSGSQPRARQRSELGPEAGTVAQW